jgi:hypothetical protein
MLDQGRAAVLTAKGVTLSLRRLAAKLRKVCPGTHLLYHFVLTYSNWESVSIRPSEN